MVVEHTFVTTMDALEAMRAAADLLTARGFENARGPAFPVFGAELNSLEMRRGRKNPNRAKSVSELAQIIRIDFDRGRVNVAASITPSFIWGGKSWTGVYIGPTSENPKRMQMHQSLLMGIVTAIEQVLVHRQLPDAAAQPWNAAELEIAVAARKRRRKQWIMLGVVFTILAALIAVLVIAINKR